MPISKLKLSAEDRGRLLAYSMGVTWALVFSIWTPSSYQGVISLVAVHAWSASMGVGCLMGLLGTLTHRDVKVELSGIYLVLAGGVLYLTAQIGFAGTASFQDRVPLLVFILWHLSLLAPRLLGLESYRRRVHAARSVTGSSIR